MNRNKQGTTLNTTNSNRTGKEMSLAASLLKTKQKSAKCQRKLENCTLEAKSNEFRKRKWMTSARPYPQSRKKRTAWEISGIEIQENNSRTLLTASLVKNKEKSRENPKVSCSMQFIKKPNGTAFWLVNILKEPRNRGGIFEASKFKNGIHQETQSKGSCSTEFVKKPKEQRFGSFIPSNNQETKSHGTFDTRNFKKRTPIVAAFTLKTKQESQEIPKKRIRVPEKP